MPDSLRTALSVSAIVPAYNEDEGFGRVLAVLGEVSQLREVVTVDCSVSARVAGEHGPNSVWERTAAALQ